MKKFAQLISLLPCHELEDFPSVCPVDSAKSLLAAWTAPWHPALMAHAELTPSWRSTASTVSCEEEAEQFRDSHLHEHYYSDDDDDYDDDGAHFDFDADVFEQTWRESLIIIPAISQPKIFAGFEPAVLDLGAKVIKDFTTRAELLSLLSIESEIAAQLVDDFFALAYARLQVELMTRKLRYSSDLDGQRFDETALAAAMAASNGDGETAKQHLQLAFDQLAQERNQYYSVDAELLDMVLLSDSIRPDSIEAELSGETTKSFVMTGATLRGIADKSPELIPAITKRMSDGSLSVVAGPQNELPDDLLSLETSRHQLSQSEETFQEVLGAPAETFMRRRAGLHASLPVILKGCGFSAAIHATLDQGLTPEPCANGIRWTGSDGSELVAIGKKPLNASNEKSFLDLGVLIGSDLDSAHVSTILFARWPTQTCDSFQDLRNSTKYGNVIGDFTDAATWFENAYDPGYGDAWEADEYVGPWFEQAVESGSNRPVSTFVDYWNHFYQLSAARNLLSLMAVEEIQFDRGLVGQLDGLQNRIELQTQDWTSEVDETIASELTATLEQLTSGLNATFVNTLPWRNNASLVLPSSGRDIGSLRGDGVVKHLTDDGKRCEAVVELSGLGQLPTHPASDTTELKPVKEPAVDDSESSLRNELFKVTMDPQSGGIMGVSFYGKRGNLLSQRLAVRQFDSKTNTARYSKMACDSFQVIRLSNISSQAKSTGRLIDEDGTVLARFVQTITLQRGRNVIDIEITLSDITFAANSTNDFLVNRIAWSDETAELFCDMQGARHPVRKPEIEAPHFVEVTNQENSFALLTHGLPWHRRVSRKKLDSILVVGKETRRTFRLGLAINPESCLQLAIAEMHPKNLIGSPETLASENQQAKWGLHLANRNLIVTWTEPMFDEDGKNIGLRLRIQETDSQQGTLQLYCCRAIETGSKLSLDGEPLRDITYRTESSPETACYTVVETSFSANEWFGIELLWQ